MAGEELKGKGRAADGSETETFFYGINIKILYMNKNEACSTEGFKASKNIPSALAKGNTGRLSMESIIVHGGVQGGRSAQSAQTASALSRPSSPHTPSATRNKWPFFF